MTAKGSTVHIIIAPHKCTPCRKPSTWCITAMWVQKVQQSTSSYHAVSVCLVETPSTSCITTHHITAIWVQKVQQSPSSYQAVSALLIETLHLMQHSTPPHSHDAGETSERQRTAHNYGLFQAHRYRPELNWTQKKPRVVTIMMSAGRLFRTGVGGGG